MTRPAANLTETPGRSAVLVTADRILYSDGTSTLWLPSGEAVTFRSTRTLTRNRHGARWIVYATPSGLRLRRADVAPEPGWVRAITFRASAGTIAGTPSRQAMARYHAGVSYR